MRRAKGFSRLDAAYAGGADSALRKENRNIQNRKRG